MAQASSGFANRSTVACAPLRGSRGPGKLAGRSGVTTRSRKRASRGVARADADVVRRPTRGIDLDRGRAAAVGVLAVERADLGPLAREDVNRRVEVALGVEGDDDRTAGVGRERVPDRVLGGVAGRRQLGRLDRRPNRRAADGRRELRPTALPARASFGGGAARALGADASIAAAQPPARRIVGARSRRHLLGDRVSKSDHTLNRSAMSSVQSCRGAAVPPRRRRRIASVRRGAIAVEAEQADDGGW